MSNFSKLTSKFTVRRKILKSLGIFMGAGILDVTCSRVRSFRNAFRVVEASWEKRDFSVSGTAALRNRAADKGLIYGAYPQANSTQFSADTPYQSRFVQDCKMLVNAAPWDVVEPTENSFDFIQTDYFTQFALDHHLFLQGGALVWQYSNPQWLIDKFKNPATQASEVESILSRYITTFVGRYAGRFTFWSVVNEAIELSDGRPDGLRDTQVSGIGDEKSPTWLHFLGADYIDLAFRLAAAADPNAVLFYNDYGLDYDTPEDEAKRNAVLKLLKHLKAKGTPIHALGIQAHLNGMETRFDPEKLRNFLKEVADLGLKILITELDVEDKELPQDPETRDRIVAGVYQDYLDAVLAEPAVIAVINWGLSDRYTWLSDFSPRSDGAAVRPLPYDDQLNRKLAWQAIARAFDQAQKRENLVTP
jgi:endo-1,4-beta-xylanase